MGYINPVTVLCCEVFQAVCGMTANLRCFSSLPLYHSLRDASQLFYSKAQSSDWAFFVRASVCVHKKKAETALDTYTAR